MKIIPASTRKAQRQWALRFHRCTVDSTQYERAIAVAASTVSSPAARYAAIGEMLATNFTAVANQVVTGITEQRSFNRFTTEPMAGISVSVDYPSAGLPVMIVSAADYARVTNANEKCTSLDSHSATRSRDIVVETIADAVAWTTPATIALTQRIALSYYERIARARNLSQAEQVQLEYVQQNYDSALAMATSFYAWHPNDFVGIAGDYLYTTPGAVLDAAIESGMTDLSASHVTPLGVFADRLAEARDEAQLHAESLVSYIDARADIDDPSALINYAGVTLWSRFSSFEQVLIALSAAESAELFQTPQSLIGVAHELVKTSYGTASITLKDYANCIFYLGRAVTRLAGIPDEQAADASFVLSAAYSSFDDYARCVGICTTALEDPVTLDLAHSLVAERWEVGFEASATSAQRAAISNVFGTKVPTADALSSALSAYTGNQHVVLLQFGAAAEGRTGKAYRLQVSVDGTAVATAYLPTNSRIDAINWSADRLGDAAQYVLARLTRFELLSVAATSSGTNWLVEVRPNTTSIAVRSPAVTLLRDRVAGVGTAADVFATPFKM